MLRKFSTTILSVFVLGVLVSSCKKSDTISNESDLTGTWYVTGISSNIPYDWNGDGYQETDIFGAYTSCQRDITLSFNSDGTGLSRQGCNASYQTFYWQLSNGNRTLNIDLPSDDINLNNLQFSSSTLRGEDQVYVNNNSYIITYTFSRR
jgi:hypothetical protein